MNTPKSSNKRECRDIGKVSGIYKIVNKTNGKYYVGSSNDINGRWYEHIYKLERNIHNNDYLQRAWNKYNQKNFKFQITKKIPINKLLIIEQKYLDIAKNEQDKCYNLCFEVNGGQLSNYSKQKISKKAKKRLLIKENHPMFGKHHNYYTKLKIGSYHKGKKLSKKHKKILSIMMSGKRNPNYGKDLSGKNNFRFDKTIYKFFNIKTKKYFIGTKYDFYTKQNIQYRKTDVYSLIKKKIKSVKNWILVD